MSAGNPPRARLGVLTYDRVVELYHPNEFLGIAEFYRAEDYLALLEELTAAKAKVARLCACPHVVPGEPCCCDCAGLLDSGVSPCDSPPANTAAGSRTGTAHQMMQDDEGHWYLIPVNQRSRFTNYVAAASRGDESDEDVGYFSARSIDGPHAITFREWEES
jgi:hypothetical protein